MRTAWMIIDTHSLARAWPSHGQRMMLKRMMLICIATHFLGQVTRPSYSVHALQNQGAETEHWSSVRSIEVWRTRREMPQIHHALRDKIGFLAPGTSEDHDPADVRKKMFDDHCHMYSEHAVLRTPYCTVLCGDYQDRSDH